jgi:PAS domain S-box-containing protein
VDLRNAEGFRGESPAAAARRLQALIDATVDAYYDWHIGSDVMDVSEQMDRLLGLGPGEMPRTLTAWEARLHPEDRERVTARLAATVREGERYVDEYRLRREDGSYVIVEDRACLLVDEAGVSRHLVGTVRDVTEARLLHEALEASHRELEEKAAALMDANTALRVLMDQREADRRALEQRVAENMQELVLPIVDRLRRSLGSRSEAVLVDVLWDTVTSVTQALGPLGTTGLPAGAGFTRRETEVANLVRLGRSTAEIAEALHLDPATVSFHRSNIRRKLGLSGRHPRLDTYLAEHSRQAAAGRATSA